MTSTLKPTVLMTALVFAIALQATANAQNYSGANGDAAKNWDAVVAYAQAWTQENGINPLAWYTVGQAYRSSLNRQAAAANTIPSNNARKYSAPRLAAQPAAFRSNGSPRPTGASTQ